MLLELALIVAGLALLAFGANFLVDGSCNIAARLGMPDRIAGLTICAVGTAMPEIFVSVTSAVGGHADMAFGNVVGSCMANLLLILGLSAVVRPLGLARRTQRFEIPVAVASVGALALVANTAGGVSAPEGIGLLVAFAAFMVATLHEGLREGESGLEDLDPLEAAAEAPGEAGEESRWGSPVADVMLIAIGIAMLKFGSDFVVGNAVTLASALGVSERVIGVTIVAVGTCLPELVTSVVAASRGNTDLAVGNVVGSNITNLLLVVGMPALFSFVPYASAYNVDLAVLAVFSAGLVACAFIGTRHVVGRLSGVAFIMFYVIYLVFSLLR